MLNILDEFTYESLAIRVARRLTAIDVIDVLSGLFILRGVPGYIRTDNGPEFVAKAVQEWITAVGAKTAYIAPAISRASRLRDELLNGEILYTLKEAKIVIEAGAVITTPCGLSLLGLSCTGAEANAGVLWAVIAISTFFSRPNPLAVPDRL